MAISVISSEKKTSTGNITIPANCDYVVALVSGATNPTINLVSMTQNISIIGGAPGTAISISTMASPPTGTWGCTVGEETRFVYLSSGGAVRDSDGSSTGAAVTLTSSATDLILGVQVNASETAMTVDGTSVTFLDNYYTGYKAAPDASVVCDGDGSALAFISIMDSGTVTTGDGTMISWFN